VRRGAFPGGSAMAGAAPGGTGVLAGSGGAPGGDPFGDSALPGLRTDRSPGEVPLAMDPAEFRRLGHALVAALGEVDSLAGKRGGKAALVKGAPRGMNRAMAEAFARERSGQGMVSRGLPTMGTNRTGMEASSTIPRSVFRSTRRS